MEQKSGAKFAVNIDGLRIPQQAKEKIAREIEGVVLKNIAELDLTDGSKVAGIKIRKEWLGFIARWLSENEKFKDMGDINPVVDFELEEKIGG
jgi:hypothetical protein